MHQLARKRIESFFSFNRRVSILMFYLNNLKTGSSYVNGYLVVKKRGSLVEKTGEFPAPRVIYLQCFVKPDEIKMLEQLPGCQAVFNNIQLNKWSYYNLLKDTELQDHLPDTVRMTSEDELNTFLQRYRKVFIKPIRGYSGKGIIRACLSQNGNVKLVYEKNRKICSEIVDSYKDVWSWLPNRRYIVQKAVDTFKLDGSPTCIRLHMNKDSSGKWKASTIHLRKARNTSLLREGIRTHELLIKYKKDIVRLGKRICRTLDQKEIHAADLGIDLGIDTEGKLWIFEINTLPNPFGPPENYSTAWTKPLEYALFLAAKS